jgi:hypothetical protein
MSWNRIAITCALGVAVCCPEPSRALDSAPDAGRDWVSEVRDVFSARCTHCHGANLPRPRGGFGYILDVKRLAANPRLVVPSRPDESELWMLVQNGEMPPPDSPTGPLTAAEKEVIRSWIASGAPGESKTPVAGAASAQHEVTTDSSAPGSASLVRRTVRWLGKFHLLFLHFPIALLLAACAAELWSAWNRSMVPSGAVRFCVLLGAAAVLPTVALGWLYALSDQGAGSPGLLALHRWLGTATGFWAVVIAVASERDARAAARSWWVRLAIIAAGLLVAIAAHFGGMLAHGEHFFDW